MMVWEVGTQKWACWVQQAMLLYVYLPSVSADLLVNQFLFFNLIFWILCHDVVIHVRIKIAWLLLVHIPVPPLGWEKQTAWMEGLGVPCCQQRSRCGGTAGSLGAAEMPSWPHCKSILVTLQRPASHVSAVCIRFRIGTLALSK